MAPKIVRGSRELGALMMKHQNLDPIQRVAQSFLSGKRATEMDVSHAVQRLQYCADNEMLSKASKQEIREVVADLMESLNEMEMEWPITRRQIRRRAR